VACLPFTTQALKRSAAPLVLFAAFPRSESAITWSAGRISWRKTPSNCRKRGERPVRHPRWIKAQPESALAIMANGRCHEAEYSEFYDAGTTIFSLEDNRRPSSPATRCSRCLSLRQISDFLRGGLARDPADLTNLFDSRFVEAVQVEPAQQVGSALVARSGRHFQPALLWQAGGSFRGSFDPLLFAQPGEVLAAGAEAGSIGTGQRWPWRAWPRAGGLALSILVSLPARIAMGSNRLVCQLAGAPAGSDPLYMRTGPSSLVDHLFPWGAAEGAADSSSGTSSSTP